jgi:hypothetical protein
VYLRDVANVHDGFAPQTNVVRVNGRRASYLAILKKQNASTLAVVDTTRDLLPSLRASAPQGVQLDLEFDQSKFVRGAVSGVLREAVIASLLMLNVPARTMPPPQPVMAQLRGGLSYVRHEGPLYGLTILAFASTFLGTPLLTLLPVVAQKVFHQGVAQYSRMMAFSGGGAVLGALIVAWLGRFRRMGVAALVVQLFFGGLIVAFALSRVLLVSNLLLFTGGAALVIVFSLMISLVQLIAPNEMRGRVMSIYMVAFRGGMPLGSLASGYVANVTSAPVALGINGVLMIGVATYFLVYYKRVRDI